MKLVAVLFIVCLWRSKGPKQGLCISGYNNFSPSLCTADARASSVRCRVRVRAVAIQEVHVSYVAFFSQIASSYVKSKLAKNKL